MKGGEEEINFLMIFVYGIILKYFKNNFRVSPLLVSGSSRLTGTGEHLTM